MLEAKVLEDIGFTKNEVSVFLSLLRIGTSTIADITKESGIHRANVYEIIQRLEEKGVVNSVNVSGKKSYKPCNPRNIYDLLMERENKLNKIMPQLVALFESKKEKYDVQFYRGSNGIKVMLREINKHDSYDAFGISSNLSKILGDYYLQWVNARLRRNLFSRVIKTHGDILPEPEILGITNYKRIFNVKEVPREFASNTSTWIFGDKVSIILESLSSPVAILVEAKEISRDYKRQFEFMWDMAKPEDTSIYDHK